MIKSAIIDGKGTNSKAFVEDNALLVTQFTCPPFLPQKNKVFSQKLSTTGLSSGTTEMGVDGSVTPVEYYIKADSDNDLYICYMTIILGYGSSAEMYEFADSNSALTNGVYIFYNDTYGEEITIANPKSNFSFMRFSMQPISITSWETRGFAASGDYGFFVSIPIKDFMPPYGIKLDRGTNQRLVVRIRDDCTDADLFNINVFGFERFE